MGVKYTKVFATTSELSDILALYSKVYDKGDKEERGRGTTKDTLQKAIHKIALSHGLPRIDGYYGINLRTGEFTQWVDDRPRWDWRKWLG